MVDMKTANPSEALECLEYIENKLKDLEYVAKQNDNEYLLSKYIPSEKFATIKQALLKAQEQEKEKLLFKNIHNTKVKTPLVSIFEGISKDERFKFTEHIYYHWEEMKEALEDKNNELEKENAELKAKAEKEHKALEIIKKKEVNMQVFNQCEDVETYNKVYIKQKDRQLTQEEFGLLKETTESEKS